MKWTKVIKAEEKVPIDEIAKKIVENWVNELRFKDNMQEELDFFKSKYNWNISKDDYRKAWEIATPQIWELMKKVDHDKYEIGEDDEDKQPLEINGMIFETKEDANNWLNEKLREYGNTYHFPEEDNYILNKLIERFCSTYFWDK